MRSAATLALIQLLQHGTADIVARLSDTELDDAVSHASASGDSDDLGIALVDWALVEALGGRVRDAARTAATAAAVSPTDRVLVVRRMIDSLRALQTGLFTDAAREAEAMMGTFRTSAEQISIVGYGPWMVDAMVHSATGSTSAALASVAEGQRMTTLIELPMLQMNFAIAEMITLFAAGRWDDMLTSGAAALADAELHGNQMWSTWLHALVGLVHARRADADGAVAELRAATRSTATIGFGLEHVAWAEATLHRYGGQERLALERLRSVQDEGERAGATVVSAPMLLDLVRMECRCGSVARAAALLDSLGPPSDPGSQDADAGNPLLAAAHGLVRGDRALVASSARALEEVSPFEAARLHHDAAALALSAGEPALAEHELRRCDDLLVRLGALAEAAVVAEWAAAHGVRRLGGTDRLTAAERRVVALVRAGNSNKQIAVQLGVSVRTIETHLSRIYGKLGVESRLRLATSVDAIRRQPP